MFLKKQTIMQRLQFILFFTILTFQIGAQPHTTVISGTIERIEQFKSKYIAPLNVDIWLPESYNSKTKYSVLYMHDGQMLFDASTTWNHQSWDIDDVASALMKQGKVTPFIVVGIWSEGSTRHATYFPQKPYESLSNEQLVEISAQLKKTGQSKDNYKPNSDNYLRFLVKELKPIINKKYSVYKDKRHTFIAGSSMGGLISMYAVCEYPQVFGGAACMSTHWPGTFAVEGNPIPEAFVNYMRNHLPNPKNHRFYFDYGDQTLDALYAPLQKNVDEVLKSRGFTTKNAKTMFFPGKDHSEKSWNERLDMPLLFLLPSESDH
jgi:predicted alpha/beta superfamily hydrolase